MPPSPTPPSFNAHVTRRDLIGSVKSAGACLLLPAAPVFAFRGEPPLTPEMFGARGDGRTDDYDALLQLASAVRRSKSASVKFGYRKRYRIDRVRESKDAERPELPNIVFEGCSGLRIDLNQSTIDVKGDFHRAGNARNGRQSFTNAVIPFHFSRCSDLILENGILTGNVDRMTRDSRVVEGPGHGILLTGCTAVLLQALHVHHFSADGVIIRPSSGPQPSRDITLRDVRLVNNARQGLTVAGGQQVRAIDSTFSRNGETDGGYRHAPCAGVDIEPHPGPLTRSDFHAVNCQFDNNRGSPVVAGSPDLATRVELLNCTGRCDNLRRMILSPEHAIIRGGRWHNVQIACAYAAHRPFQHEIAIEVSGGTWSGDDPDWAPIYDLNAKRPNVRIHRNRFELRALRPFQPTYLFQCANENHIFVENSIFVAATGHDNKADDLIANFSGATVGGNSWSTDLRPPRRFLNNYKDAHGASEEIFSGSFSAMGQSR